MPDHRFATSAEVHEPKHITNSSTGDSGSVITPSSSSAGTSELRRLALSDLSDGAGALTESTYSSSDVFNYQGWELVEDGLVTTPTISIGTSPIQITIDDEGISNNTNSDHLPLAIRGVSNLFDTATSKIEPIASGDTYLIRVNTKLQNFVGTPTVLTCQLDIGTGSTPTSVVAEQIHILEKTPPYSISFVFPVFSLNTFMSNGGRIFFKTNTGTLDIADRSIFITRLGSGNN